VENYQRIARLSGNEELIDSNLEFALLTFYSPSVIGKRPNAANNMLPSNNVRIAGLRLGAAVYKDMLELSYFDPENTDAIERHLEMMQFIMGKANITRTQIEQHYRANIRNLITEIVDEEYNKINFSMLNTAVNRRYFMTMQRFPQNGRYTLTYEVPAVIPDVKIISATARETMINEMRRRSDDFSSDDIDFVRAQAALIPAVALPAAVRTEAVTVISAFYLNLNPATFSAVAVKYQELSELKDNAQYAAYSFSRVLASLNDILAAIADD